MNSNSPPRQFLPSSPQRAIALLEKAAERTPYFLLAASGGKDSNACFPLLDTMRKRNPRVRIGAFYMWLVKGLRCIESPIEALSKRYDVPLRMFMHPALPKCIAEGYCRPKSAASIVAKTPLGGRAPAASLSMVDVELAARTWLACLIAGKDTDDLKPSVDEDGNETAPRITIRELGIDPLSDIWYVGGHRSADSLERRAMLSSFRAQVGENGIPLGGLKGLNAKERRIYPLHDWKSKEVLAYCRAMRLPPAADLGQQNNAGLDPGSPEAMRALRRRYPQDYRKVLEVFPLAAAAAD